MYSKFFNFKSLLKGIGYLVLFIILPSIISIPFNFIKNQNNLVYNLQTIITYIIISIIFILLSLKDIKQGIQTFNKQTLKKSLLYWLIGLIIMLVSSTIIGLIGIDLPSNETANRTQLYEYPITQIITSIIFAPIIEEIIFRQSFKDLSSNKHIYAIFTGLFFGLMHLPDAFTNSTMLIHLIPYASCGIAFGYIYKDTDNIIATMVPHSLHNLISILKLFIIGG